MVLDSIPTGSNSKDMIKKRRSTLDARVKQWISQVMDHGLKGKGDVSRGREMHAGDGMDVEVFEISGNNGENDGMVQNYSDSDSSSNSRGSDIGLPVWASGTEVKDLHRHKIDHITIPSKKHGVLRRVEDYVLEELNVQSVVTCNDPLKYASLRAEPDFSVLGKRLGKSMGMVSKEVKAMSQEDILAFEKSGEITVGTHCLKLSDIKIVRAFKRPADRTEEEMDAAGDGDVLVVLDLRQDESLLEAGFAREVVNRIQKLRKKAALDPTDMVEVFFRSVDEDASKSQPMLNLQESYIRDILGSSLLPANMIPQHAVVIAEEIVDTSSLKFVITLTRPALMFNTDAILALYAGNTKFSENLQTYLLSRDHHSLKSEFQANNGKINVSCIIDQPKVELCLGEHVYLTVGDYLSRSNAL